MGLDLVLYKRKKGENPDWDNIPFEDFEKDYELCYGRKTWSIVNFFQSYCGCKRVNPDEDFEYIVTENNWEEFENCVKPYAENKSFRQMLEDYIEEDDPYWEIGDLIEQFVETSMRYDGVCQLGAEWDAHAILNWYDSKEEVRKAFKDGYEVILQLSY